MSRPVLNPYPIPAPAVDALTRQIPGLSRVAAEAVLQIVAPALYETWAPVVAAETLARQANALQHAGHTEAGTLTLAASISAARR